ncbi:hypothetical protein HNV12_04395 [Methanococcoides sp. SA1]|nr:hypothetical protein [Methanococcoides sp. SA1]
MIFDNPFFTEMLLPFLLVFVVVFAILQKSKILANAQVDAIVGLVVGLILIGVPGPRDIVVGIMPWLAVGVAVILVFLILYGFVAGDLSGSNVPEWLKNTFLGLAAVFTVGVVLFVSGLHEKIWDSFGGRGDIWMNVVMIALVLGAVLVAVKGGNPNPSGSKDK